MPMVRYALEGFLMRLVPTVIAVSLILSLPALAQHGNKSAGGSHAVGGGYIPKHGPPPSHGTMAKAPEREAAPHQEAPHEEAAPHASYRDQPNHPEAPHVHHNGQWVGHDAGRDDARYHLRSEERRVG